MRFGGHGLFSLLLFFGMRSFDWRDYWASAQPGQLIRNDTVFDENI